MGDRLKGKVAIVTGAGSVQGRRITAGRKRQGRGNCLRERRCVRSCGGQKDRGRRGHKADDRRRGGHLLGLCGGCHAP